MSLIKNLKSREFGSAGGQRAPMLNLAVQVESYDGDRVVGTRLDTGEPVRVFLRALSDADRANLKKPRPEIADFVAAKGYYEKKLAVCDTAEERAELLRGIKNKTEPGGVIMFDACYKDKSGEYSARWANSTSRFENHCNVITNAQVRANRTYVGQGRDGGNRYNVSITVANVNAAVRVNDGAALRDALVKAFEENGMPNGAGVMVRVSDGEQVVVMEQQLGIKKVEGEKNEAGYQLYEFRTAEESADYFMKTENGKELASWDGGSGLTVEVVPTITMKMGSFTKSAILGKSSEYTDRETGEVKTVTGDQKLRDFGKKWALPNGQRGFTPCVVSFAAPQGVNAPSFMVVQPTTTQPVVMAAQVLETAHIKPSGPLADTLRVEASRGAVEHAAGPVGDGVDLSDYDPAEFEDAPAAAAQSPRRDRGVGM